MAFQCPDCSRMYVWAQDLNRHRKTKHGDYTSSVYDSPVQSESIAAVSDNFRFQHPFTMVVAGPSGSGKTRWMRKLLACTLIQPPPERIIWCYGQWQHLYEEMKMKIPHIEFVSGIPSDLEYSDFIDTTRRNLIVFDDLMSNTKCDQRVSDLFTKGSHHRNLSVVCLNQNLFPQGKACRDIALNTQYLVLFNNPIDRQQISTLSRRSIHLSSSIFLRNTRNRSVVRMDT